MRNLIPLIGMAVILWAGIYNEIGNWIWVVILLVSVILIYWFYIAVKRNEKTNN